MRILLSIIILLAATLAGFCQASALKLFPLSRVRLLNSPFKQAQEADMQYMLALLGGNWVGAIKPDDLPVEMEIDWVRFYKFRD